MEYIQKKIQSKQFIQLATLILWIVAILSMSSLTLHDFIELVGQYKKSEPVTRVEIVDSYFDGMKIPNSTLCIHFQQSDSRNDIFIGSSGLNKMNPNRNYTQVTMEEYFKMAHLYNLLDSNTLVPRWWKAHKQQTSNFSEFLNRIGFEESFNVDNLRDFYRNFATYSCDLLNFDMNLYYNDPRKVDFPPFLVEDGNLCQTVALEKTTFVKHKDYVTCFRVPLDFLVIKPRNTTENFGFSENEDIFAYAKDQTSPSNPSHQMLQVTFRPLSVTTPDNLKSLKTVFILPEIAEIPLRIKGFDFDPSISSSDAQFQHVLRYPDDINHFTETTVKVEVEIEVAYQRLKDTDDCADVFHELKCINNCRERNFESICNCTRFSFQSFLNQYDPESVCTPKGIYHCVETYNTLMASGKKREAKINEVQTCYEHCSKCTKVQYHFETKIVRENKASENFCGETILDDFFIQHNTSCFEFGKVSTKYIIPFLDYVKQLENRTVIDYQLANDLKRKAMGQVKYEFRIKSFTYPLYSETLLITKEGFVSQIGGLLGLYLGFSGLTCFALLISLLKMIKKRLRKKEDMSKNVLESTVSILNFWYHLGRQNTAKKSNKDVADDPNNDLEEINYKL